MKVKTKDGLYDGQDSPIMVILTDQDKENIINMDIEATRYCMYPNSMTKEQVKEFMDES